MSKFGNAIITPVYKSAIRKARNKNNLIISYRKFIKKWYISGEKAMFLKLFYNFSD